ncbi:MAG: M20/M25/M40 family metallo-hydrolase [Gemmatimonadetes bacterium]|nr:M20/M25/M40 family metallo-hydrolase [Gemmatimonadota bacterium]
MTRRPMSTAAALLAAGVLAAAPLRAQAPAKPLPRKLAPRLTHPAISAADLMTRLYILADDSMQGRRAGEEGGMKGTAYIAAELKKLGLVPAGDNGTFFQDVPLVKRSVAATSNLSVDGTPLVLWQDYAPLPVRGVPGSLEGAQVVYGGALGGDPLPEDVVRGKVVVVSGQGLTGGIPRLRIAPPSPLAAAAAVAVIVPELPSGAALDYLRTPTITMRDTRARPVPAVLLVTPRAARVLLGAAPEDATPGAPGKTLGGRLVYEERTAPARNVVAILPGSDPTLKHEYVAIGAHSDHVGIRATPVDHDSLRAFNAEVERLRARLEDGRRLSAQDLASIHVNVDSLRKLRPARLDSISNGADDDGSGSVAVLELAEAFAKQTPKPKRSILFVWHTGEELGLLGSRWFTDHPTVPRDSIVAQLNMDMVGRGGADDIPGGGPAYLQLVGSRRLSTELGDLVEAVNKRQPRPFTFDYQFDANGHPENIYCRSDHYNYARYGIPITFFTTGLHKDYHQVTDEPQYIDYDHLARVAMLVHDVAMTVANLDHRPVVDKPKPDPNGVCRQ